MQSYLRESRPFASALLLSASLFSFLQEHQLHLALLSSLLDQSGSVLLLTQVLPQYSDLAILAVNSIYFYGWLRSD